MQDAHRFAPYFEHTIIEHPLLLYTCALPFAPRNTIMYKNFHHGRLPLVVAGVEPEWPPLLQILRGHEGVVRSVCFSPDGSRIVSGSSDNTVRVWDALSGQPALPPLQGHENAVWSVCFSPDGSRIVSRSWGNTVRVWDACTGHPQEDQIRDIESLSSVTDSAAQILVSLDKGDYFCNVRTGRYLGRIPPGISFSSPWVQRKEMYSHQSCCVLFRMMSDTSYVPLIIHFPA